MWCEVVRTEHTDVPAKWYFYRADLNRQMPAPGPVRDGALVAAEVSVDRTTDPCELYFADFKDVGGKKLAHRMEVRHGDKRYAMFNVAAQQMK